MKRWKQSLRTHKEIPISGNLKYYMEKYYSLKEKHNHTENILQLPPKPNYPENPTKYINKSKQ